MTSTNPIVSPLLLDCDPDQHSGDTSRCSIDFDKWYLKVSIKKLLNVHTSVDERWNITHWMTAYPFVSHTWADPELRNRLLRAAQRFRDSGEVCPDDIDPLVVYEVDIPSLELEGVCFSLTKDFDVVPFPTSFEAVCLRLDLDPEELPKHLVYMMHQRGIQGSTDSDPSLVKPKKKPAPATADMFGTNFADPKICIRPFTHEEVAIQLQRELNQFHAERRKNGVAFEDLIDDMYEEAIISAANSFERKRDEEIDSLYEKLKLDDAAAA